jgi:sugar lactone lactonase YvrE
MRLDLRSPRRRPPIVAGLVLAGALAATGPFGLGPATGPAGVRSELVVDAAATSSTAPTAAAHPRPGRRDIPGIVEATAPSLHPEGVAWDPTRRAFLVGSTRHGTVSVVGLDGSVRTLVSHPLMVSTFGVHVDARRDRVLVAYGDVGLGERSSPDTLGRVSGIGIFDLATGRPRHLVDLATTPSRHAANDLAIDSSGTAYVTDVQSTEVYRVDVDGRASVLVRDGRFASSSFGMNGIVWHPGGFLLAVRYDTGTLFRIGLGPHHAGQVDEVTLDQSLVGGDGMLLRGDGGLDVMTNSLGGAGVDAVHTLRSGPGGRWSSAREVATTPWPDRSATTLTATPRGVYAVAGRLDVLLAGQTSDTFVLRRR